ncbi:unnamed protein product [Amoebophrya sp. A120]|nr:unnamed protein product [Amoebophrya sp. A120]|eukprot:GSA120T00008909001.1
MWKIIPPTSSYRCTLLAWTSLLLVSTVYEPVRVFILDFRFGEDVGGVGGVGGLCNMWNPRENCTTTAGGEHGPYCFQKGMFLGFTPFALVMLLVWTVPVAIFAMLHHCWRLRAPSGAAPPPRSGFVDGAAPPPGDTHLDAVVSVGSGVNGVEATSTSKQQLLQNSRNPVALRNLPGEPPNRSSNANAIASDTSVLARGPHINYNSAVDEIQSENEKLYRFFQVSWVILSAFWFALPLLQYETGDFFAQDVWHRIIGFAIAAAFPLSWHIVFVAILSFAARILVSGNKVQNFISGSMSTLMLFASRHGHHTLVLKMHKFVAWNTVFWAVLHGGGELVWFVYRRELWLIFDFSEGENLLYLTGLLSFLLLAAIGGLAAVRNKHPRFRTVFKKWHKTLALLFLITATAHWWPFAIFLVPTVALGGVAGRSWATYSCSHPEEVNVDLRVHMVNMIGKAIAVSLFGALVGLASVWQIREFVMGRKGADTFSPFLFPPLALVCGGGVSVLGLRVVASWSSRRGVARS